jgi:hypothetical protein
MQSDKSE